MSFKINEVFFTAIRASHHGVGEAKRLARCYKNCNHYQTVKKLDTLSSTVLFHLVNL